MKALLSSRFLILIIFVCIVGIYLIYLFLCNVSLGVTGTSYYNLLVDAFLHGRTNIIPGSTTFDLSEVQGKWFMYWGPSPVFFVLPFYLLFGITVSDVLYVFMAGLLNIVVFYVLIKEFSKYFQLKLTYFLQVFMVVSFAIASPNFLLSLSGGIWYGNQVMSALYLLVFYFFFFKFLNVKKLRYLILCVLFFNCAWMGRFSLVFNGLLFLYPLYILFSYKKALFYKACGIICVGVGLGILSFMAYNFARFHNFFEIGYKYQHPGEKFKALFEQGKLFSLSFIPHNATHYFLNHALLSFEKPYLHHDAEGNSVFSVYPATLLLLGFMRRGIITAKNKLFIILLSGVLGINLLSILSNLGSGWMQFGSRYFFDVLPGVFLLILFVLRVIPKPLLWVVLVYGILVNLLGVYMFYNRIY